MHKVGAVKSLTTAFARSIRRAGHSALYVLTVAAALCSSGALTGAGLAASSETEMPHEGSGSHEAAVHGELRVRLPRACSRRHHPPQSSVPSLRITARRAASSPFNLVGPRISLGLSLPLRC
jgi:hypothetical protein